MTEAGNFNRIIGGSEEDIQKTKKEIEEYFESQNEKWHELEAPKTPEDILLIEKTNTVVNKIVQEFGGEPKLLPLEHIYIVKSGSLEDSGGGVHNIVSQAIAVEKSKSSLLMAQTMAHEFFHFQSFKSARFLQKDNDWVPYRSGIAMYDIKKDDKKEEIIRYFGALEEAIVAECSNIFRKKIEKDPLFKENFEAIHKLKGWIEQYLLKHNVPEEKIALIMEEIWFIPHAEDWVSDILNSYEDEKDREAYAMGLLEGVSEGKNRGNMERERYEERKNMYNLFDEIIEKSEGEFKNHEEVFSKFAKANFTGEYGEISRIIERILGTGKFREIAERFSQKKRERNSEL